MEKTDLLKALFIEMTNYFKGDSKRIFHLIKVHAAAAFIASQQSLSEDEAFITEAAAYIHDIGIKPAEEKYGSCTGKQQELEGAPAAEKMLSRLGFCSKDTERIKYLVAHHHTYDSIDGIDYQILVESDLIVNMQ